MLIGSILSLKKVRRDCRRTVAATTQARLQTNTMTDNDSSTTQSTLSQDVNEADETSTSDTNQSNQTTPNNALLSAIAANDAQIEALLKQQLDVLEKNALASAVDFQK
jgi:hypothetical protein